MQRRDFLAASIATSALAFAEGGAAQTAAAGPREYYQIRRYQMRSGPQTKLTESYIGDALIPALTRLGMGPIGAFQQDFGSETPAFYVLMPGTSAETDRKS